MPARRVPGFKNSKKFGNETGEPTGVSKSSPKKVGKTFNTLMDRGNKAAKPGSRHKTASPKAFGGGKTFTNYPDAPVKRGGGANTGAGATTSSDI